MIRYLKNHEIDRRQWDSSLNRSYNQLIYASSWYLDIVAPGWEALVSDNYLFIMPLPGKKKYGISYVIQPKFVQQLGIFSTQQITPAITEEFIKSIPRKFLWRNFYFNSKTPVANLHGFSSRTNYELNLSVEYEILKQNYCSNTRRNISKASKHGISIETMNHFCGFHELYKSHSKLKPDDTAIRQLQQIMDECLRRKVGEIVLARNRKMEVIAGAFFLKSWNRIIYLCSFSSHEGYLSSALFLMMDEIIRRNCSAEQIFDFEGSMRPGIARFFSGFGASPKNYHEYKFLALSI